MAAVLHAACSPARYRELPPDLLTHRAVGFSQGRLRVSPIELDSNGAKALRAELPETIYESGRSTVTVRVPDEPAARFPALVAAAEAILRVATDPSARQE